MVYVYIKNGKDNKGKLINEIEENFNGFNQEEYTKDKTDKLYFSEEKYLYPVIENNKVRMKTREEFVLEDGIYDYLIDGEFIENGEIKKVDIPEGIVVPIWDSKNKKWLEGASKIELVKIRKNAILKYAELKREVQTLNELSSEFGSYGAVEMLEEQRKELKKEINKYTEQIEQLK